MIGEKAFVHLGTKGEYVRTCVRFDVCVQGRNEQDPNKICRGNSTKMKFGKGITKDGA